LRKIGGIKAIKTRYDGLHYRSRAASAQAHAAQE
jgi:hypothetical protein